jgi:outer membrane receptor protein involved in Fe transport
MKSYTLAILFFLLDTTSYGADIKGIVKGKVYDGNTLEPLIGVEVIYGKSQGTRTDDRGDYLIKADTGKLNITFSYVGYKQVTKPVIINSGDTIVLNVGLDQEINEIDQIVVSANRTGQKVSELSVSVGIIKPNEASKNHITDTEELINKTSGIEILDGQASIRGGSAFSYGAGSRVLALIDGLPVLSPDAGNIKWQFLPLENLSQVEIIKGASSVLYGSSALNGIINFRTADATGDPVTKFYIETGLYDKPKQKNWIWWDSPRIFSSASFSYLQKIRSTDIGIGSTLINDNGYRRLNDEKIGRLNLRLRQYNQKVEGLSYGINLNTGYTAKTDFILWEDADSGALKQNESTAKELHGSFFACDPFIVFNKDELYRHDLRMRIQSVRNKFPENDQNNSNGFSFFTEYQLWHRLFKNINLTVGLSENYNRVVSNFYGDHEGFNIAGFTQVEVKPVERLMLTAGLRAEHYSLDREHEKIIPIFRTGLNYQAATFTFLRASFGQGYRYPSIAEKYASTTIGSVKIFPEPTIQPESGWSSEVGIKQGIFAGKMNGKADLALFYSQNSKIIEYIFGLYPDPVSEEFGYGFKATNMENSRVYGFEAELMLNRYFGDYSITADAGYTFMYPVEFNRSTRKNTDIYLKYRRKHSLKIDLSSKYRKFEIGLTMFMRSKILNIDDVFLNELTRESILPGFYDYWMNDNKAYFLMDLNFGFNIGERYNLSVVVKNITNTEYMGRPGDIMPQRNFSLRFSGKF